MIKFEKNTRLDLKNYGRLLFSIKANKNEEIDWKNDKIIRILNLSGIWGENRFVRNKVPLLVQYGHWWPRVKTHDCVKAFNTHTRHAGPRYHEEASFGACLVDVQVQVRRVAGDPRLSLRTLATHYIPNRASTIDQTLKWLTGSGCFWPVSKEKPSTAAQRSRTLMNLE